MENIFFENFATTYSCNAYGSSSYSSQSSCSTASGGTTGSSSSGSSRLIDTGVSVILPIVLGIVLIGSAIMLLIGGKKKRMKNN